MSTPSLEQKILVYVQRLAPAQQSQVLAFVEHLATSTTQGTPGVALLRFAGTVDQHSLHKLQVAVESDCEDIRPDEW
jgi:hypothetical protein